MKNKILLCACAVVLGMTLLTSCRPGVDFQGICDTASEGSLQGLFSGVEAKDMTLYVAQYDFAKEGGAVTRTVMATGDGVYRAPVTTNYSSWQFGEYTDLNLGRLVVLNPADGGEPLTVKFIMGGIEEEGQPVALDKNDKISDIPAAHGLILGKKWAGLDTTFYRIDTTINVMKVDSIVYKHREGRKYVIDSVHYDTTYVPTKMKWNVGPSEIVERHIELNRDQVSNANTGVWKMSIKKYEYDANKQAKQVLDSTSNYNFHWCFADFTSSLNYVVKAVDDNQQVEEYFEVKYDVKKNTIVIDKQELKDVTE